MTVAAEEDAERTAKLVGREVVAITKTRSATATPVAEVQFTAAVVEAAIVELGMLQKPKLMPAMVEPPPPTTRLVVLAVPVTPTCVVVALTRVVSPVTFKVPVAVTLATLVRLPENKALPCTEKTCAGVAVPIPTVL